MSHERPAASAGCPGPTHGAGAWRRCSITWWRSEVERKALGAEVLHLYREINLIYSFSEKLAALLDVERVAQLTLQEARHLIVATDGVIMLLDEASGVLTHGRRLRRRDAGAARASTRGRGIVGAIAATGVGEIVNDVDARPAARHRARRRSRR